MENRDQTHMNEKESNTGQDTRTNINSSYYPSIIMILLSQVDDEIRNIIENDVNQLDLISFMQVAISSFWKTKADHTQSNYHQLLKEEELFIFEALKMYLREKYRCGYLDSKSKNANDPSVNDLSVTQAQALYDDAVDWINIERDTDWSALYEDPATIATVNDGNDKDLI